MSRKPRRGTVEPQSDEASWPLPNKWGRHCKQYQVLNSWVLRLLMISGSPSGRGAKESSGARAIPYRPIEGLNSLFWASSNHQPHISPADVIAGRDFRLSSQKWVLAFQHLKPNSLEFYAHQLRVEFVNLDLIWSGLNSMGRKSVISYDQPTTRLERTEDLLQHRLILLKVVVCIHHQNDGQRINRKGRIADITFYDFHIFEIVCLHPLVQPLD